MMQQVCGFVAQCGVCERQTVDRLINQDHLETFKKPPSHKEGSTTHSFALPVWIVMVTKRPFRKKM